MSEDIVSLKNGTAAGASIDLGPVRMVYARKDGGFVGCGVFDATVFDRFKLAAARVSGVSTLDDLLNARVNLVNETAAARGVRVGMTGREALEAM